MTNETRSVPEPLALDVHDASRPMRAFITVGSTKFDALIQKVFTEQVLSALQQKGYTDVVVQCGNSTWDGEPNAPRATEEVVVEQNGVTLEIWKFKPSLEDDYDRADLVISHAGSGTILDVLRRGKLLIVVPNPTLLHNHQQELADVLSAGGHLRAVDVDGLAGCILRLDPDSFIPFPQFEGSKFASVLDETMGFA